MAHVIAQHCGYNVVEINASDDRTSESFKNKLTGALEVQSVFGDCRPNMVIIDEIDGVSQSASSDQTFISLLLKTINAKEGGEDIKKSKKKKHTKELMRPIICVVSS
jgi:chromosome transmission fidelity protein 18